MTLLRTDNLSKKILCTGVED